MTIVLSLLINAFAIFIASQVLTGVHVDSFITAIIVALVLGLINIFLKPVLLLLTLPLTLITFGLFAFVINALMVLLVGSIVGGFSVDGFWWALLFSLIVSVVSSFANSLVKG